MRHVYFVESNWDIGWHECKHRDNQLEHSQYLKKENEKI